MVLMSEARWYLKKNSATSDGFRELPGKSDHKNV